MLCEKCKKKQSSRKQVMIRCTSCGIETYASIYNNNKCQKCNEQAGTCEECGRMLNKQ